MKLLENLTTDRRKVLAAVVLILAIAVFLRFFNIGWSFSNNGVDEGIMLERARLVGAGYDLYTELPCDQAPLVFLIGGAFDGDVLALRVLTASLSMVAIIACMVASKRLQGNTAMLLTGLLLAVDFTLLRESRLFSLDGLSAFFLAMALPFYLHFLSKGSRPALALAGFLVGLSAASKLFGGIALAGMLLFMAVEHLRTKKEARTGPKTLVDILVLAVSAAVPLVVLLLALGPSEMLNGMVFDQGHRQSDLVMKLSIPIFFGLNLAYAIPLVYARSTWAHSKEARFLLILTAVLLANFVLQPLVFLHHMVLMSPGLAVLSGAVIARVLEHRKERSVEQMEQQGSKNSIFESKAFLAISMVGILVSAGLASYGIAAQERPGQLVYAEKVAAWTTPDDWVISGDPLIAAYAQRLTPPGMVNVGTRVYPELTIGEVEAAVVEYDVAVFLLSYRFLEEDMAGLGQYLVDHGYEKVADDFMGDWNGSSFAAFEDAEAPSVFVRSDIVDDLGLPTEAYSP